MTLTRQEKISIAAFFVGLAGIATAGCNRHDAERERSALHGAFIIADVTSKEQQQEIYQSIRDDTPCSRLSDPEACEQVKEFYHSKLAAQP